MKVAKKQKPAAAAGYTTASPPAIRCPKLLPGVHLLPQCLSSFVETSDPQSLNSTNSPHPSTPKIAASAGASRPAHYAERAAALAGVDAIRLCLKDPGGRLTPDRTRTRVQTLGERYRGVTDQLIRYALGHWGREEADGIDPDVKDRILGRPRARELAQQPPSDLSLKDLRRRLDAGPSVDDDELLLRSLTNAGDVAALRQAGPVVPDPGEVRSLASLLRELSASRFRRVCIEKGGFRPRMRRDGAADRQGADAAGRSGP